MKGKPVKLKRFDIYRNKIAEMKKEDFNKETNRRKFTLSMLTESYSQFTIN